MARTLAVLAPLAALLTVLLGPAPAEARDDGRARWRLEPADFLHYRVVDATIDDSDETRGAGQRGHATDLHGFYGYEVEDARRLTRPVTHVEWLYAPFAFRLPEERLDSKTQVDVDEVLPGNWRLGPVRARGRLAVRELRDGREAVLSGLVLLSDATFEAARTASYYSLGDGRCTWTTTFDLERGVATRVEYELHARTGYTNAPTPRGVNALRPGERSYRARVTLELDRRYEHRFSGFTGRVDRAILASTEHLLGLQQADGSFVGSGPLGTTGLALLALVRAGLPTDHPAVARGYAWLLAQRPRGIYETGAAIMAVEALVTPPEEMRRARRGELAAPLPRTVTPEARRFLQAAVDYVLENAQEEEDGERPTTGHTTAVRWGYPFDYALNLEPQVPDWWDNSNTQYAVLGLNAAARCGIEVPLRIWIGVAEHYLSVQAADGAPRDDLRLAPHASGRPDGDTRYAPQAVEAVERGWAYRDFPRGGRAYGSMTTAGIASLAIARAHLTDDRHRRRQRPLLRRIDAAVRDGWAALDAMWTVWENPSYEGWTYYHLYGLERAGVLADVERLGGHDWSWEGALQLLLRQAEDGSWPVQHSNPHDAIWALLFLSRSTTPITPR